MERHQSRRREEFNERVSVLVSQLAGYERAEGGREGCEVERVQGFLRFASSAVHSLALLCPPWSQAIYVGRRRCVLVSR
jgi:hypothetical protein